ncbi:MAG: metallophosphoesterase family protein [Steroidobacteraceae bacterium]
MSASNELRVGVMSDTHGLLRAEARAFLTGCDYIIHGGDVGSAAVLEGLEALAPLIAVRGNNDNEPWAKDLRETELIRVGGIFVYVIHDLSQLDIDPGSLGVRAVICGHSHKPLIEERAGILYINPGSCGPKRFKLPVAIGELFVEGANVRVRIVELAIKPRAN